MPVEYDAYSVETERLERMPVLVKVGMGEAEHPAGILVSGHHSQPAIVVTFFGFVCKHGGRKCGISGFPSPITAQIQQSCHYANQYQE